MVEPAMSAQYAVKCSACGGLVSAGVRFCAECGAPVSPPGANLSGAVAAEAPRAVTVPHSGVSWRAVLMMMVNPGGVLKGMLHQVAPPLALGVSGLAFCLFFLQTGLDMNRVGSGNLLGAATLAGIGLVYGTAGVAFVAALAWLVSRPLGGTGTLGWTVRAFGLGYSPTLVYVVLGVLANLVLGWNTSLAFGVTGVLWALGPMVATLREILGGRIMPSIVLATVCGGALLLGWTLIGS
jgi:hypothetical protein